jgi:type IV secretion system protein VirB6/type IV secretion system protein TrbL
MHPASLARVAFVALLIFAIPAVAAEPVKVRDVAGEVMDIFNRQHFSETILEAAKSLFQALATISLVWTMGLLILRQDIGEMLMELLRFIVVTGTLYWLLINASTHDGGAGFVDDIVQSFFKMVNDTTDDELIESKANSILARGLHVFYSVFRDMANGDVADRILSGLVATMILAICAFMSAQFVLALVMAWILGYAGIFLLGFGGARWTSQIAINFYKHVVAVGVALLALSIIGTVAAGFLDDLEFDPDARSTSGLPYLGLMLGASILMMVLSTKVPQLLYTLVTGSTLGLYAGFASAAGTAIASAGASARGGASTPSGGGSHGPGGASVASGRSESVMDAVQRSASLAGGMSDPFHVGGGSDPFGAPRRSDPYRQGGGSSAFVNVPTPGDAVTVQGPAPGAASNQAESSDVADASKAALPESSSYSSYSSSRGDVSAEAKPGSSVDEADTDGGTSARHSPGHRVELIAGPAQGDTILGPASTEYSAAGSGGTPQSDAIRRLHQEVSSHEQGEVPIASTSPAMSLPGAVASHEAAEDLRAITSTDSATSAALPASTGATVENMAVSETHAIHDEPTRATPGSAQDSAVPAIAMADQGHEFQAGGVSASRPDSSATTHVSAASVEQGMAAVGSDGEASLVSHPTAWASTTESQVGVSSDTDQVTVQGAQASATTKSTAFDSTQQIDMAAVGNTSDVSSLVLPGAALTAIPSRDGDHASTESRTDDDITKHDVNRISVTQADMASTESGGVSREVPLDGASVPLMPSTDTAHITVRAVPEDPPRRDAP